jgi:hypothetical protein
MSDTPQQDTPIAELFARNPGDLSSDDLDQVIAKLRTQRKNFIAGNMSAGSPRPPSAAAKKAAAAQKVTGKIDLTSLGL